MALPTIAYHRPATLADACALGIQCGADGAFLAGGTELLPDYHRGREGARQLIALEGVEELHGVRVEAGTLWIGALTTVAEVARSTLVREWCPALAEAAGAVGSPPIRSLATIGGNFCRAVPCADTPPPAIVGRARLDLLGPAGAREVSAEAFFVGPRQTVLLPGELLIGIRIPRPESDFGASYQRFARRRGSALAVAAVAAGVGFVDGRIVGARIALGAVAPIPLLATRAAAVLEGESPSDELFAVAGATSAEEALPISDLRGSAAFRRELVAVLTRRALHEATSRTGIRTP